MKSVGVFFPLPPTLTPLPCCLVHVPQDFKQFKSHKHVELLLFRFLSKTNFVSHSVGEVEIVKGEFSPLEVDSAVLCFLKAAFCAALVLMAWRSS